MTEETIEAEAPARGPLDPGLTAGSFGPRVRVLWNLLSARTAERLAPFGLRTGAYSTMALIAANPGCSQNQLAKALGMDKSAVVAVLDELETKALARRMRPAHDRRRHALELTPEGEALVRRMSGPVQDAGQPIRDCLSRQELTQLISLLERAYDALAADEAAK